MSDASDTPLDPRELTPPVQQGVPGYDVALVTARRAKAVALRCAGLTYEQIAKEVGYADKSVARVAVVDALREVESGAVAQLRELEGMRLDQMQAAVWRRAVQGDLQAIRTILRISERRARLFGLDAPLQVELVDGVDEQLGELRAALADDEGVFHPYVVPDPEHPESEAS